MFSGFTEPILDTKLMLYFDFYREDDARDV